MEERVPGLTSSPIDATRPGKPMVVRVTQAVFFLMAGVWIAIGGATAIRLSDAQAGGRVVALVLVVLIAGNAAAYALVGWGIAWRSRLFFILGLLLLAVNILLTFTDQFGPLDFITLCIDIALVVLLIVIRSHHVTRAKRHEPDGTK